MKPRTPLEVLETAISFLFVFDRFRFGSKGVPGEVIERLDKEDREILQKLTADQIALEKLPRSHYFLVEQAGSPAMREFDKTLLCSRRYRNQASDLLVVCR